MNQVLNKIREIIKLFGKSPGVRKPIFHFSSYIDGDHIYYGEWVDKILKIKNPDFNSKHHQGFLVPIKYKKQIEELEAKND